MLEEAIREVGQALDDAIAEALAHAPAQLVKLDITTNYAVKYFLFDFSVDRFSCVHFYSPFETKSAQSSQGHEIRMVIEQSNFGNPLVALWAS